MYTLQYQKKDSFVSNSKQFSSEKLAECAFEFVRQNFQTYWIELVDPHGQVVRSA